MGKKNSNFVTIWDTEDSIASKPFLDKKDEEQEEVVKTGDVEEIDQDKVDDKEEETEEQDREDADTEEVDEKQDEDEDESKEDASSGTGYAELIQSLVDEEVVAFNPEKEYDLSPEGLKELIQDTAEQAGVSAVEDFKESLGEKGKQLLEMIEKGLSVEDYVAMQQQVDFSTVDVNNPNNQHYLVEDWLKVQGHTNDEIKEMLEHYSESGILDKQAKIAQRKLIEWQDKSNKELIAAKEKEKQESIKAETEAAAEFKNSVLELRNIAGFEISKKQAADLYDYITKAGKDGKTQFQSDDNLEKRMLYAYMSMIGFDKTALSKEVATKQAIKLKKTLSNHTDTMAKAGGITPRRETSSKPKIHWNFGVAD